MIKGIRNFKYYLSEVRTILKLNGISSLLSVLSLSLIFLKVLTKSLSMALR